MQQSDAPIPLGRTVLIDPSGWTYLQKIFSRKVVLWASFIAVLWFLRDFFPLFLFTFVLSYLASTVVDRLNDVIPHRRLVVCLVFVTFVAILTALCLLIIPTVVDQVRELLRDVNQAQLIERTTRTIENFVHKISTRFNVESIEHSVREAVPGVTKTVFANVARVFTGMVAPVLYFLLALLLAFFMVLDLPNIKRQIHRLEHSRLRDYYLDVYPGVIAFFSLLGRGLEAQTVIALINTSMTSIGLAILGVPNIAMLSVIVFLGSYIPVLGMWLTTVPIVIVALPAGGLALAVKVVLLVVVVHLMEAYVINPRIYGAHMHVHPLMVLIILTIGEHIAGLWGLVLGVPIWTYVWRYAILGQHDELWAAAGKGGHLEPPHSHGPSPAPVPAEPEPSVASAAPASPA